MFWQKHVKCHKESCGSLRLAPVVHTLESRHLKWVSMLNAFSITYRSLVEWSRQLELNYYTLSSIDVIYWETKTFTNRKLSLTVTNIRSNQVTITFSIMFYTMNIYLRIQFPPMTNSLISACIKHNMMYRIIHAECVYQYSLNHHGCNLNHSSLDFSFTSV